MQSLYTTKGSMDVCSRARPTRGNRRRAERGRATPPRTLRREGSRQRFGIFLRCNFALGSDASNLFNARVSPPRPANAEHSSGARGGVRGVGQKPPRWSRLHAKADVDHSRPTCAAHATRDDRAGKKTVVASATSATPRTNALPPASRYRNRDRRFRLRHEQTHRRGRWFATRRR
jgi:hypothetical protein